MTITYCKNYVNFKSIDKHRKKWYYYFIKGVLFWPALPALVITAYLHFLAWPSSTHKPDWAYPKTGESSYGGKLHAVYFFGQLTLVLTGAWLLAARELSLLQQLMFGLGGISYLSAMILDVKSKKWEKIPPKQTTQKDYPFG